VELSAKNLNNLPVLHALLEEASVVNAAHRVGLAQPTVSGILARLRDEFADQLLVRDGRTMKLTTRGEQLRPIVAAACADLAELYAPAVFDPAALDRLFVIAAPDHLAVLLSRPMLRLLGEQAPQAQVQFVNVGRHVDADIESNAVDLAVCADFGLWPRLYNKPVFVERIVAVVDEHHPLAASTTVTMTDVERFPISAMGTPAQEGEPISPTGVPLLDARPQVILNQFTDAVMLTIGSQIVAGCPEPLVDLLAAYLPIRKLEIEGANEVQGALFWSEARDRDPALSWLRALVEEAASTIGL
jgi:DNA-binding transcriptional LysR family regulator